MNKFTVVTDIVAWLAFAYSLFTGWKKYQSSRPKIDVKLRRIGVDIDSRLIMRLAISNQSSSPAFISEIKLRFEDDHILDWLPVTYCPVFLSGNQYTAISTKTVPLTLSPYETLNGYFAFYNHQQHAWPISDKQGTYRLFVGAGSSTKEFELKPRDKFVELSKELDLELGTGRSRA